MTMTNALRLLNEAGIAYTEREYNVDDGRVDAVAIAEKIGIPEEQCFKTLVTETPAHEHFVVLRRFVKNRGIAGTPVPSSQNPA